MRRPRLEENLEQTDLVISPGISDYTRASFEQALELVEVGRRTARRVLPQLEGVAAEAAARPLETGAEADTAPASPGTDPSVHIRRITYSGAGLLASGGFSPFQPIFQ